MLMDFMKEYFTKGLNNELSDVIYNKIREFKESGYKRRDNFPIISLDDFIKFIENTCWSDLDEFCEKNPEFDMLRRKWLIQFCQGILAFEFKDNDLIMDFSNLDSIDKNSLHRSWTYFEDGEDLDKTFRKMYLMDETITKKPETDEELGKHLLFDPSTGNLLKKNYEYVGNGYVKNLDTGKTFYAVKSFQ